MVLSCYYMPTSPVVAMLLYMTNVSLDELDGRAARRFKQTSQFGALLDTITDRLADTLILTVYLHPKISFDVSIFLSATRLVHDISSLLFKFFLLVHI